MHGRVLLRAGGGREVEVQAGVNIDAAMRDRFRYGLPYPIAINYKRIGACPEANATRLLATDLDALGEMGDVLDGVRSQAGKGVRVFLAQPCR